MWPCSKVLVLAPHTDDGELGCGGTMARFVEADVPVFYAAFSTAEKSVPQSFPKDILQTELRNSTRVLGIPEVNLRIYRYEARTFPSHRQDILEDMIKLNKELEPDLVLVPSSNDLHQDHQVIHNEALRAFKMSSSIWGYEHPWNNLSFTTDVFVNLREEHIGKKIEALQEYCSQDFRTYFSETYIRALAYTRGTQVNFTYAEAFEMLRMKVE